MSTQKTNKVLLLMGNLIAIILGIFLTILGVAGIIWAVKLLVGLF